MPISKFFANTFVPPLPNCDLILVTPRPTKLLRALLPWVISGEIRRSNGELDLLRLCRAARAQLVLGEVERIDLLNKFVALKEGGCVYFDYLSLNLGTEIKSALEGPKCVAGNRLEYLLDCLDHLMVHEKPRLAIYGDSPLSRLLIRGLARLKTPIDLTLISQDKQYLHGLASLEKWKINSLIKKLQAKILTGKTISKTVEGKLLIESIMGETKTSPAPELETDLLILADEGELSTIYEKSGFAMQSKSVLVNDALQLSNCKQVYVAGPHVIVQGHLLGSNPYRPSSRFGKVIAENLRRELKRKPLIVYRAEHALVSWLPSPPELLSLAWGRLRSHHWQKWLKKQLLPQPRSFVSASAGEIIRSDSRNTFITLISGHAKLEGVEPFWLAQVLGRRLLHQSLLKRVASPTAMHAHLNLMTEGTSNKMIQTKSSQVQAGLEIACSTALEIRVSSGREELLHLGSNSSYQPNLKYNIGDLIYLVGHLGSVESLFVVYESNPHGESWYRLRNEYNRDLSVFIRDASDLGITDGSVLDERGLLRVLEEMLVPNNLAASIDLDRIPLQMVNHVMSVDKDSSHLQQNLLLAKYLPEDVVPLLHHPRFLALFGSELTGMLLILPREKAKNIARDLGEKHPELILTPIGALTEGPVRFRFRVTTR